MNAIKPNGQDSHDHPTQAVEKRILFIQINRIGDIIQTYQICKLLREQEPHLRIDLVARECFLNPIKFLLTDVFDHIYAVDTVEFIEGNKTLAQCFSELDQVIDTINSEPVDLCINCSFSNSSSTLATLIQANHKFGMFNNEKGHPSINDKWSSYIYGTVMSGQYNGIHLIDIFRLMIGIKINSLTLNDDSTKPIKHIAICPFASHEKKRWRIEKWTEIVHKLQRLTPDIVITIVGGPNDRPSFEKMKSSNLINFSDGKIIDAVGTKPLSELFESFNDQTLFIGHDSMLSHLSSIRGSQTLTISIGTPRPWETAPYGSNHYILSPQTSCYPCFPKDECHNYKCHSDISYQVVVETIEQLVADRHLSKDKLTKNLTPFHIASCDISMTSFDGNGLQVVQSLLKSDSSVQEVLRSNMKKTFLFLYEEIDEDSSFPALNSLALARVKTLVAGVGQLFDLYQFGMNYSRYILEEIAKPTPELQRIKAYGQKLDEIDQLLNVISATYPELESLCRMTVIKKANLRMGHIVHLTEQTYLIYNEAKLSVQIMHELLSKVLDHHQVDTKQAKTLDV